MIILIIFIPYPQIPNIVITTIIPFKGNLVYDGILLEVNIKFGTDFEEMINKEYTTKIKYYHL